MAIDDRYVFVDKPPQTGETLANLPLLKMYNEVLKTAERNEQNGYGAYYMTKPSAREVSYCYILNSIYRDLLKWQNKQPDNPDIPQLRQEIVTVFQNVVKSEFPHIGDNYEVNPDYMEFDTKDATTGEILAPRAVDLKAENSHEAMSSILKHLDDFLNKNKTSQVYEEGSFQERERQKKFDQVSFRALRKMQYYLVEKISGKQVYSFQSTEEKARAHRNTLKRQIEPLTHMNYENSSNFERNQQILSNTLDELGMRMVWCQEPPYEAEFVDNLYAMKKDLQQEKTPPEFYNTKLPVFLNLCKNMQEFNPAETEKMSGLLQEFMDKPSKEKLVEVVEETQRVAMELREVDQTKSKAMRAAWDGVVRNPVRKNLSPAIHEVLKLRDLIGQQNLSPAQQQKRDAYLQADYTVEEYQKELQNNKTWNICKQVPQFANIEGNLLAQMKAMALPPQKLAELKYDDFAFLINRNMASKTKQMMENSGVEIPSDKEAYLKDLVAKNEKELRRTLFAFYQKKHTLNLTLEGRRKGSSEQVIAESISNKAKKEMNATIRALKNGKSTADFNAHHVFPLSNIAYYERMTGKNFSQINKEILYINRDIHELMHINENAMDGKGLLHFGKNISCRTKYIHKDRMLKDNKGITGYYDSATMGIIMPKKGIKVMVDFNSYIFDSEKLAENIQLQEQTIEYRQTYDAYMLGKTQKRAVDILTQMPQDESQTSKSVSLFGRLLENISTVREYCSIAGNFNQLKQNVTQAIQQENREPTSVEQSVLKYDLNYYQPIAAIPHVSTGKVSQFLTQAVELLSNKAKEFAISVGNTLQAAQPILHPEMDKARQMVKDKNQEAEPKAVTVSITPQTQVQKLNLVHQEERYG